MARRRTTDPQKRELELIQAAYEEGLTRIKNGTATDTMIAMLIRQGSAQGVATRERTIAQTSMFRAKVDAIKEDARAAEKFEEAIAAMQRYSGKRPTQEVDNEAI